MPEPPSRVTEIGRGISSSDLFAEPVPRPPHRASAEDTAPPPGPGTRHGSGTDGPEARRLLRLAVLPAGLTAVVAAALVGWLLRAGAVLTGPEPGSGTVGAVLATATVLCCAIVMGGAYAAWTQARSTTARYAALRREAVRNQEALRTLLARLERGERPARPDLPLVPEPEGDAFGLLAHECTLAQRTAEAAVVEAALLTRGGEVDGREKVEVFVNLARRLQSLVHREIELLDELENDVEDPDLLKGLFQVDHLATRVRRHAENLAVLGGAVSRRQWTRPVTATEVLRSAIAEVEQYPRVKLLPPVQGTVRGHAVADVIHLLAELVENATVFSSPRTSVSLRAQYVTAGLAVEVEDRGLGMTGAELARMNALLADPRRLNVSELLQDGRIGLFVVSQLARRHGIAVRLQSNIYGGVQAVLVLPKTLLGDPADDGAEADGLQLDGFPPDAPDSLPAPDGYAPSAPPALPGNVPRPPAPHGAPVLDVPAPRAAPAPPFASGGPYPHPQDRPLLPRRRRQEHLVPELRDPPQAPREHDGAEPEPDPGLIAAFRRGTGLAEDQPTPRPVHPLDVPDLFPDGLR
ncbi:sensor histidine kinase [Streptomyces sp. GSL17-111]|uniref:sensor histidine kinase n=1 Tax=Streptomyces sp. GSL17-111 TaxID=3121596 RepID=UPI0030F38FF5